MKPSFLFFLYLITSITGQTQTNSLKFLRDFKGTIHNKEIVLDSAVNKVFFSSKAQVIEARVTFNTSKKTFYIGYYVNKGRLSSIYVHEDSSISDFWRTFEFEIKSGEIVSDKCRFAWSGVLTGIARDPNEDYAAYFSDITPVYLKEYTLRLFERIKK